MTDQTTIEGRSPMRNEPMTGVVPRPEEGPITPAANEGPHKQEEVGRQSDTAFRPFAVAAPTPTGEALHESFEGFMRDVLREVERATLKFPCPDGVMCALTEEVGELAKAVLDEPRVRVWAEAIQVAAMAARVAVEGDPTLDAIREKRGANR